MSSVASSKEDTMSSEKADEKQPEAENKAEESEEDDEEEEEEEEEKGTCLHLLLRSAKLIECSQFYMVPANHRIIEWFGLEGTFKII